MKPEREFARRPRRVATGSLHGEEGHEAALAAKCADERDVGAHEAEGGSPERFQRRLGRLGALFGQVGQILRDLAQDPEIQLAVGAEQSVHATAPEGTGMDVETDTAAATASQPGRLLDLAGLAEVLSVAPRTVRRWRGSGKLPPAVDVGGLVRWRREDVDRWLEVRREAAP